MLRQATYVPAIKGLATSFADPEIPVEYASLYTNRHPEQSGSAAKRRGLAQLGSTVTGQPTITGFGELVAGNGTATLFATGEGKVYKYDGSSTWTQVHAFTSTTARVRSVMMSGKLIFFNGTDRNYYTDDGTNFYELKALIEVGTLDTDASATAVVDPAISAWATETNVVVNDVVHNVDLDAYAVITNVASAKLSHTAIGSAATGIGLVQGSVATGHRYEVLDAVELNVIPTKNPNDFDNEAVAGSGTSSTSIKVSGATGTLNFNSIDVRAGDWIYNSTRAALTQVTSVATALGVVGVTGQVQNDSLVFLKSAAPIIYDAGVHYGRLYAIDARDRRRVRISSPDDPQDFTSDGAALDLNDFPINSTSIDRQSFNTGALQPVGDVLVAIRTFQRFLALVGRSNAYFYEGTEPVGSAANITPVGLYPQGCVSTLAAVNLGNDFVYVSPDGVKSVTLLQDASSFNQADLSNQIDATLRDLIQDNGEADIQMVHYRRRSWLLTKVGDELYVFSFAPVITSRGREQVVGSWHLFDGLFAQMKAYFVRLDGTLVCGGAGGIVAEFDGDGVFDDLGQVYRTQYRTGWLNMTEPRTDVNLREGHYVKPNFVAGGPITYTLSVEAPYDGESRDTVTVAASGTSNSIGVGAVGVAVIGGSGTINDKVSLLWKGEVCRLTVTTEDDQGPDVLSRFSFYYVKKGKR